MTFDNAMELFTSGNQDFKLNGYVASNSEYYEIFMMRISHRINRGASRVLALKL